MRGNTMITVAYIRKINYTDYNEVWAIVRSLKNPGNMKHVPALSPSWNLFKTYLGLRDAGKWNAESFRDVYMTVFLREMRSPAVRDKLTELIRLDRQGKRICLACFCPDETLCHRSIVAGILQYAGIPVNGVKDNYSQYGRMWCAMP
jgi:uncharacterized protein YeaO (DUF488 family)